MIQVQAKKVALICIAAGLLTTGCSVFRQHQVTEVTSPAPPSTDLTSKGYDTVGRRWGEAPEKPAPVVTPVVTPAPAPAAPRTVDYSAFDIKGGLVTLTKRVPASVAVGEEYAYDLTATANEQAGFVVITDQIPEGATYIKSEPPAEVDGRLLTWKFPSMDKGEVKNIKVWLKADREGELQSCATITAVPRQCTTTFVGKPALTIEKTGPETARLGSDVAYTIVVSNKGSLVAKDVVVTDPVPDGYSVADNSKELSFKVGDLAPNQSKNIPVTFKANQRGKICNVATVKSSNAGTATAEACTVIQQPGLKVAKTAREKQLLINRTATYDIVVENTGDTKLTGVVVSDSAAPETKVVEAVDGQVSGNTATWNVGDLDAGAKKALVVKIMSATPGNFCNTVTASASDGLKETSQACSEWIGVTGVLIEMVDDPDPIQVGETTTYTIRVTNQGSTRNIEEVNIVANFAEEIDPTSASGNGVISGKTVTFPVVASIAPKQAVTYTIVGKGLKAGDHRMQIDVTTKDRTKPISKYESTTVY
jgi:uncharacterized repeat protein (TIGR01451 family)